MYILWFWERKNEVPALTNGWFWLATQESSIMTLAFVWVSPFFSCAKFSSEALQRNFLWHILRHDDGYNPRWAGTIICQSFCIQKQIFTKFYKFRIYLRLCDLSFLTSPLCHPVTLLKTPAFGWINNPRRIGGLAPISHNELLWSFKAGLDISFEALRLFSAHNWQNTATGGLFFKI